MLELTLESTKLSLVKQLFGNTMHVNFSYDKNTFQSLKPQFYTLESMSSGKYMHFV